jgi:hypothetical protein
MTHDHKLDEYKASRPSAFKFIKVVSVVREFDDVPSIRLDVTLAERPEASAPRRSLVFHDVHELRVKDLDALVGVQLEIRSMRGDGLEGIRYKVLDVEHELLSFVCGDFDVIPSPSPLWQAQMLRAMRPWATALILVATFVAETGVAFEAHAPTLYYLGRQLRAEQAASAFAESGGLSETALQAARQIFEPGTLGNPAVPEGFGKFATDTFPSPSGPFQVHFYMNPTTQEVFYGLDYKAVFNNGITVYTPGAPWRYDVCSWKIGQVSHRSIQAG